MRRRFLKAGSCVALGLAVIAASGWMGRLAAGISTLSSDDLQRNPLNADQVLLGGFPVHGGTGLQNPIPDAFGFIEGERDVMSADGLVGYSTDLPVEDARRSFAQAADRSGWRCRECEPAGLVCEGSEGEARWAYAVFSEIGETTSVVVSYQIGD